MISLLDRLAVLEESQPVAARDAERSPSNRKLLGILLAYKVLYFALIFILIGLFPIIQQGQYGAAIHWPREGEPTLGSYFATWDAAHYLLLSEDGYTRGTASSAFYPLWPGLIRLFSYLTFNNHLVAGLLLANVISVAALFLFYRFVEACHGTRTAGISLVLLLAWPGALFFSFIYTEALFYLLIIGFFFALMRNNVRWLVVTAFLLPLTKAVGVFCLLPLLWHLYQTRRPARMFLLGLIPVAGYACYFLLMAYLTGDPLDGFKAQKRFPNQPSVANIFKVGEIAKAFINIKGFHGTLDSFFDRFLFVIAVASFYRVFRLRFTYFLYAAPVVLISGLSMWFFSYTRHFMLCFPFFIVLALWLEEKPWYWLWTVVSVAVVIHLYFLGHHINFFWVA